MNSASLEVDDQPHGGEKHPAIGATGANQSFACPDAAPLKMLEKNKAGQIAM
jgi:hypothetical protein